MRCGSFEFRPALVPSLAALLLLPVLLALGFWQLDRAEQKRAWEQSMEAGAAAPALNLNAAQPIFAHSRHRLAQASGDYDPEHAFLLDNQIEQGRAGYRLLMPLRLSGTDRAVLVDRGWLQAPSSRQQLPELPGGSLSITVVGRIDGGPSVGMRLGAPAENDEAWPRRIQYIDFDYLQSQVEYDLMPYLLQPDERSAAAAYTAMPAEKHVGYAVQWFALALTLVVIYVAVNLRRRQGEDS
jgi:surfeit locus 1 family protein